jgi:hypothetical protein
MPELYYTPPSDEVFQEVKSKAMILWKVVDTDNDEFGYATEKINRITDIENVGDNLMYIVAMFDIDNQKLLATELSKKARKEIRERMIDGGTPEFYIVF